MIIREEKKREFYTVTALVREAYISADRSTGREYKLVEALRESDARIFLSYLWCRSSTMPLQGMVCSCVVK